MSTDAGMPELRPMTFEDLPGVQRLESENEMESQPEADWKGMWLDNPLWPRLGSHWPIGWVMLDGASRVVGSVANVPSRFHFRGRELLCANGRGWVVAPEYRGFALWLMDEYYSQPDVDLILDTTVGPKAIESISALTTRVPVGDWQTIVYWVTGYLGFATRALEKLRIPLPGLLSWPAAAGLWLKDLCLTQRLPPSDPALTVESPDTFDERFDAFWYELIRLYPNRLLGFRDRASLNWHYAMPLRRKRLWVLTASRNGLLRAFCVFKRQDLRQGVKRMRLVDYQTLEPDVDLLPALLGAALRRCRAEGYYVLEKLGIGLPKTAALDRHAPYRLHLPNWKFFYKAPDETLANQLASPDVWDPSEYDGDASFD